MQELLIGVIVAHKIPEEGLFEGCHTFCQLQDKGVCLAVDKNDDISVRWRSAAPVP